MESARSMVELAEWNSFNGVSVNDEAEFIAHLFPNSSLTNELETSSNIQALSSSTCWTSNDININIAGYYDETNTTLFYSSDYHNNSCSFYSNFSQGSCKSYENTDIYLRNDNDNQFLEPNTGSLPFGFVMDGANSTYSEVPDTNLQLKRDYEMSETELPAEEKISSDISEDTRKRYRVSDNKEKRMGRRKKSQKRDYCSEEESDEKEIKRQNSSSCSSQDDCNGSLVEQNQLINNGKTRANRGSATDPQSIYARKRRERINERLRILQNLVPNGTKVDISTMLEEAVRYVKFLQLQIKLLSSDEMWMYAPLAYNGMDIGLDTTLNMMLNKTKSTQ